MSKPHGYVWTSLKDGMETRFTNMYPNEFYKPFDIVPVYTHPAKTEDEGKVCARCGAIAYDPVITQTVKTLTDEEINVVAILQDAEIVPVGHEIWKTGEEFNKYKKIVLATAKALRKAQEK